MSIKPGSYIVSYDLELIQDKLRKVWQDFVAGNITPDMAGMLLYTENANLDVNIGNPAVDRIYEGRSEITEFFTWITSNYQTELMDCTTVQETSTHLTRNCLAVMLTPLGTQVLDLEIIINKDEERIENQVLSQEKGNIFQSN